MADSADGGQWHRVCLNTIVRKGRELDSERLRILPMGSRVRVQERVDRRVRIDMPVGGWCSLRSSNGDTILSPLNQPEDSVQTPSVASGSGSLGNQQKYFQNYKNTLQETKEANQAKEQAKIDELKNATADNPQMQELASHLEKIKSDIQATQTAIRSQQAQPAENREAELQELERKNAELQQQIEERNQVLASMKELGVELGDSSLVDAIAESERQQELVDRELAQANNLVRACQQEMDSMRAEMRDMFEQANTEAVDSVDLRPGDVVRLDDRIGIAIVRYFGAVEGQDGQFVGVELNSNIGDTNGTYLDTEYFNVKEDHGMFMPLTDILERLTPQTLLKKLERVVEQIEQNKTARD